MAYGLRRCACSSDVCSSDLELVGIAHRAPRPIQKRDRPYLLISVEDFVAGLSGYPERPAHLRHALAVQKPSHKPQTFFFHRTLLPRHQHLRPNARKCYPCVRYKTSPMSRVAQLCPARPSSPLPKKPPDRKSTRLNSSHYCASR